MVLCRELAELGQRCCRSSVSKYVAPWRAAWRPVEPTVRFETGPGEQGQVDWGTTWIYLGLERVRVHLFTMVLGFSRRLFAKAYRNEGLESLLDGHASAFEHFGGRPESLLYDNPRTIVTAKDETTGEVSWNATFKDRMDSWLEGPAVPLLPGADQGQGGERHQVRQRQCPGGPAVRQPR